MKKTAILSMAALVAAFAAPAFGQGALNPNGSFADKWGTTFTFSLCGSGTDLCGKLDVLKGDSATPADLAYVGNQVIQAKASGANVWKGQLSAGGMSGEATITQTGPNTIDIQGCRAMILCETLTYTRQ